MPLIELATAALITFALTVLLMAWAARLSKTTDHRWPVIVDVLAVCGIIIFVGLSILLAIGVLS